MKRFCVFLTALLFLGATVTAAQPVPGKKFELGTSVAFSVFKFSDSTDSQSVLTMQARFGYFLRIFRRIEASSAQPRFCRVAPRSPLPAARGAGELEAIPEQGRREGLSRGEAPAEEFAGQNSKRTPNRQTLGLRISL